MRVFPSDWLAGTARMSRLHRSVYFDVCMYIWDKNASCPASELPMMLGDLRNWRTLVDDLIDAGKMKRLDDGSLLSDRAKAEAQWAFDQWHKRSFGGKGGRNSLFDTDVDTDGKTLANSDSLELPRYNQNQNQNHSDVSDDTSQRAKRGTRISDDWKPAPLPPNVAALVAKWPPGREQRECDGFRDFWSTATKSPTKLDWDRTWHNRIRDVHDRVMRDAGNRNGSSGAGAPTRNGFLDAARTAANRGKSADDG